MVVVNQTSLYLLALDILNFTQTTDNFFHINSIKSCKSTEPHQLVTFLSEDDFNRSRLLLMIDQEEVSLY